MSIGTFGASCAISACTGHVEGQKLAGGFKDLSTTVELGQASNAMRRASSTLPLFVNANVTMIDTLEMQKRWLSIENWQRSLVAQKIIEELQRGGHVGEEISATSTRMLDI